MSKFSTKILIVVFIIAFMVSSLMSSATRMNLAKQLEDSTKKLEAINAERKELEQPQVVKGNWTLFQYQYGWTNKIYSTEHYFQGDKLYSKDRESGELIPVVYDDNCLLVPGWIEGDENLSEYGIFYFDDDFIFSGE